MSNPEFKLRLEILVTAFNEESVIVQTLESLVAACARLRALRGDAFEPSIVVGLDHCTDATAGLVAQFAANSTVPVVGIENIGERGKWSTLNWLVARSGADWVACVDAGSIWREGLLAAAWASIADKAVIGVAPSYSPSRSGALERANWRLERALKKMENTAGGPVSVHGATVLYRRSALLGALAALHGTAWLNDDVVVPLTLRLQNPASRIVYLAGGTAEAWVGDVGVRSELSVEYRRRRRMVMGNLQWIRNILLPQLSVILIASRRVFRVFWAYWLLLSGFGVGVKIALALQDVSGAAEIQRAVLLELGLLGTTMVLVGSLLFSNWARRLVMAFCSGLMVTRYWKELGAKRGVSWV